MESVCFAVSGKPHKIQKIFNKLKNSLSNLRYVSDFYIRNILLPRGTSEIEVLREKGYLVSFAGPGFSIYSNLHTSFSRESGMTLGLNSRLFVNIRSENPSKT